MEIKGRAVKKSAAKTRAKQREVRLRMMAFEGMFLKTNQAPNLN